MMFDTALATRDDRSEAHWRKSLSPIPVGVSPVPSTVDDVVVEDAGVDAEGGDVCFGDVCFGEVSPVVGDSMPVSAGRAYAMPGVVATAAPTPNATASAPT